MAALHRLSFSLSLTNSVCLSVPSLSVAVEYTLPSSVAAAVREGRKEGSQSCEKRKVKPTPTAEAEAETAAAAKVLCILLFCSVLFACFPPITATPEEKRRESVMRAADQPSPMRENLFALEQGERRRRRRPRLRAMC